MTLLAGLNPGAVLPAAPVVEWAALSPVLVITMAAVLGVLVEAFVPRSERRAVQLIISFGALITSGVVLVMRWLNYRKAGASALIGGEIIEDGTTLALQSILLITALLALLVMTDRTKLGDGSFAAQAADRPGGEHEAQSIKLGFQQTEIYPLTLFSLVGMMVFPASGTMLTMFVALEVMSLPLYVLAAMARRRRLLSQEAAFKYFLLGAFSSAVFLMGVALIYGYSGSLALEKLRAAAISTNLDWLALIGIIMVLVGLLFKVGAVPFHAWTPDVYQGAPTPVTGFMAAAVKTAAFGALIRFFYVVASPFIWDLQYPLWGVAILTMIVGTILGIVQKDLKRMLAYSSIAHAGFILIGVLALAQVGIVAVLFYLLSYAVTTVGAFGVITLVRQRDSQGTIGAEATLLQQWQGLGKTSPFLAISMLIFLLSFAGIPLTGGFMGKFTVFTAGILNGQAPLVVIAVICSVATAFFYFRLVQIMFFMEPEGQGTVVVSSEGYTKVAIVLCLAVTVLLGVVPGPVLDLFTQIAVLLP